MRTISTNRRTLALGVAGALLIASSGVRADEVLHGIAVSCDPERERFSILADLRADGPMAGPFTGSEARNIEQLERGEHVRECNWEGTKVSAVIVSWRATNGQCAGAGGAILKSIAVNDRELALVNVEMSDYETCTTGNPHPASIAVETDRTGTYFIFCRSRWTWEEGWHVGECSRTKLEV